MQDPYYKSFNSQEILFPEMVLGSAVWDSDILDLNEINLCSTAIGNMMMQRIEINMILSFHYEAKSKIIRQLIEELINSIELRLKNFK